MSTTLKASTEDLYLEKGKAEIINGEIVTSMPTGWEPGMAGFAIAASLRQHQKTVGGGYAVADNMGFIVDLPDRQSFSPDAAWYTGKPAGMRFAEGAPVFAVEVHSENDYGPKAERAIAEKRRDYFAAGTLVVWDVDLLSDEVIKSYHKDNPDTPAVYKRGDIAHAEPAVPGWTMKVDELFE